MKILFIDNLLFLGTLELPRFDLQPHLGLMSLVSVLRAAGHESAIYDPKLEIAAGRLELTHSLYDEMAAQMLAVKPEAIGFTALGCNFHCIVQTASRVKTLRPGMPILLGGPHATILANDILRFFPAFDIIIRGEAESNIVPVVQQMFNGDLSGIPGITYRTKNGDLVNNPAGAVIDDLDELPIPAYDCYPLASMNLESIRIEAGRGCPFSCTFCSTASFFGRSYRLKSTSRLVQEMESLNKNYGYTDFKLNHDLFTVNRKKVLHFCEAVADRRFTWACSARMDCVDEELLRSMHTAGCRRIYFGVETGSSRMQEVTRKCLDVGLVDPTLAFTELLGIRTVTSYITGYPDENICDQEQTLDQVGWNHCRPLGLNDSQLHLLTPEPGTQLLADSDGRLLLDDYVSGFNLPRILPEDGKLHGRYPSAFVNHYHFPTRLPRNELVFVTEAWVALHSIGRSTLQYLLRAFGGKLSRLLIEAYAWRAQVHPLQPNVSVHTLVDFIQSRFGSQSHLASLLRHAVLIRKIQTSSTDRPNGKTKWSVDDVLMLSHGAAVGRGMHDYTSLHKAIAGHGDSTLIEETSAGPLADYVFVNAGKVPGSSDKIDIYEINSDTAFVLSLFEQPQSYLQCCHQLSKQSEQSLPQRKDFKRLIAAGILEIVSTSSHN